ncbi:unnamed protein product [Ambrosiozyma monospora]|uniref:Unnamed protein product n=1 Tax=Ambrosiozyma monospora TaxID=43982 RepID=A0A9W6Z5R3_AMBMO|nr:unnamed protein product [Ambrosiozyma monospora]
MVKVSPRPKPLESLPVKIMEDDRFQLELPSKVNWKEFVPKLRERQLHELEPAALELIHQTYINLIDFTDTIHVFTTSQFLQFLSIYLPFFRLKYSSERSAYFRCTSRFKCKSRISVTVDEEKCLFYLRYAYPPVHGHTGTEIVEMVKVSPRPKPLESLPVKIMEDDRFQLEIPSKVNWIEFVPKLRERQLHELEPAALELIHQTYINLIDFTDTIHVFTTSQFLQFLSIYLPFLKLAYATGGYAYLYCPYRFKCESRMPITVDEEKGLFYLRYVSPPVHGHTGTEIVEMAKVSLRSKPLESLPAKIMEDDRYQIELPSKVNWIEFVPKLRERQLHELEPAALELIHQTYINLIDLTDTIHVFTVSQFLQFLSIYLPFFRLKYSSKSSGYLYCRPRFKCESRISVTVDEEKCLFYLRSSQPSFHTHSSTDIVEMAKVKLLESLPAKITEDDRFQLELPSKVNWKEFVPKLREPQLHELEPAALELIHQTYINLIDLTDKIHVFTVSQLLQFLSVYLPFLRPQYSSERSAYFSCTYRFKCKSRISVAVDEEKGLFYLRYVSPPVHNHSSAEVVEMAKVSLRSKPLESLPVKIMEDDRFQLELPSKVNWKEFVPKLRERQLHELEPAALDIFAIFETQIFI